MDTASLIELILEGGGAGLISYYLIEYVPALKKVTGKWKRPLAWAITGAIAILAWSAGGLLGVEAWPTEGLGWSDALIRAIFLAITTSQLLHSTLKR